MVLITSFYSDVLGESYKGKYKEISTGAHILAHNDSSVRFGAYVFGTSFDDCAYAFPAGMSLYNLTLVCKYTFSSVKL